MTFAYWDKNFLKQPQLLNSQNGEWLPVDINFVGNEDINLNDKTLVAKKYQVLVYERVVPGGSLRSRIRTVFCEVGAINEYVSCVRYLFVFTLHVCDLMSSSSQQTE